MAEISKKREIIVAYLEFVLHEIGKEVGASFEIITPKDRGTQLSVLLTGQGKSLFHYLMENGIILDWREPNVIRVAPAPLYCSYEDVFRFGQVLKEGILSVSE